jgi:hypothetical protein
MTITVEQAEAQLRVDRENLASLLNQLADLGRRTVLAVDEREQISYQALVDGDAAAKCRLNQIHTEAARQQSEAASINAAVDEATRRVNEAEEALTGAQAAQKARSALTFLHDLKVGGTRLDACVDALLREYTSSNPPAAPSGPLGQPSPPSSLCASLSAEPWLPNWPRPTSNWSRSIPNSSTGSRLSSTWAPGVTKWAAERLPNDSPEKEEAA